MKIPSKVTPYKESTIAKFPIILSLLEQNDMTPNGLYAKVKKSKINKVFPVHGFAEKECSTRNEGCISTCPYARFLKTVDR